MNYYFQKFYPNSNCVPYVFLRDLTKYYFVNLIDTVYIKGRKLVKTYLQQYK